MSEDFTRDELLEVPRIAEYLRVSDVTVYRWCREGRLPCLKLGNSWRIRRSALEDFLERGEQSATLFGQLRAFYRVPDNVLAIAYDREAMYRLDAAFFGVGEVRRGLLVKLYGRETGISVEELHTRTEAEGLEVSRLKSEGRWRPVEKEDRSGDHVDVLKRLCKEVGGVVTLRASFDWVTGVDVREALERQKRMMQFTAERQLVVQTTVLEGHTDQWPPPLAREAQLAHSATVWLSEAGLATTRVAPVAER